MQKTVSTDKARQGGWGRPVLVVLVVGLLLAMVVWAGVEIWGERIDTPAADNPGGVTAPANDTTAPANGTGSSGG